MIYFDHNATTPVLPEVFEAMQRYFCDEWGNPSSAYRFGSQLKQPISIAREQVADLIGASPNEVIFTSCATESNHSAIRAALLAAKDKRHVVTSTVEHSSVLKFFLALEEEGYEITYLPVGRDGLIHLAELEETITERTALVSLMWANNETGVLFPVREIAGLCYERGICFHCDAVQAAGKLLIDLREMPVDYLSLSGHKFYGPKGAGALYIRQGTLFTPYFYGGEQEEGRRGGTENTPLIVGLGKAAELAKQQIEIYQTKVRVLRDQLEEQVLAKISGTEVNGHKDLRLPNTTNIAFSQIESETLLVLLDQAGMCASKGSACLGNSDGPSHVLKAMKSEGLVSRQSLRFSLGINSNREELRQGVEILVRSANLARAGALV